MREFTMSKQEIVAPEINESEPYVFTDLGQELTHGFAHKYIRFKIRQIIGCVGIPRSRREELEQDLRLLLIRRFPKFDPKISAWPAFVVTIIERRVATLVEHGQAMERCGLSDIVSLSEAAMDEEGQQVELADQLSPDHQGKMNGQYQRTESDRFSMLHDLDHALMTLPEDQRKTCEELKRISVTSLARRRKLPRATMIDQLVPIREALDREGISEF